MPYVGATELTLILPQNITIDASSTPLSLGEVATILSEVQAELDSAAAAAGYALPIATGATTAYAQMQRWTKLGGAAQVLGIIFPNMGGPGSRVTLAADYAAAYRDALKALRSGMVPLIGATLDPSETVRELPRSYETSNTASVPVLVVDMDSSF